MTTRIFALLGFLMLLSGAPALDAATIAKVDGIEISDEMLSAFARMQTRKPLNELNADEKKRLTDELLKLVAVGAEARKQKLHNDPAIAAQLKLQELSLLAQTLVSRYVDANPVTNEQLQARYNAKYGDQNQTEFKARHILLTSPTQATEIIGELDAGADFSELAKKHSTGPSAKNGGDLGWFTKDTMVPEFANAVAQMASGSHSASPVQTQFGWHVIFKEAEREAPPPAISSVGKDLERELQQQAIEALVGGLRDNAKVKTYQ